MRDQFDVGSHVRRFFSEIVGNILSLSLHKRSNSKFERGLRKREVQRKKNCDGDLVFDTGNQGKGSLDSFRVFPREKMVAEKLQHLITKLGQKLLGASVFGKSEKRTTRPLVVENHYQRTELPAKGDGQWILFR